MATVQASKMIGTAVKRKEDPRLITGGGQYTDDIQLKGLSYMAVLRSPHAHARILSIETSRALQHPEVLAVLTGQEINQRCATPFPLYYPIEGMRPKYRWPMAADKASYVGEPVAVVVATSRGAARDAVELIDVEYEPLPVVIDVEKAAEEGSTLVHEELGSNLCHEYSKTVGDPDRAFREADGVVSARLTQPRLVPNPMEPRAVIASYERSTGNMTMWNSTQNPHFERSVAAGILGFPENKLRVIAIDVGGGFGCKCYTYPETIAAALFSMQLGRPVKWTEERQEGFMSTSHGRGQLQYVEAAYKKDGTLLGMRFRIYGDLGAYCAYSTNAVPNNLTPSMVQGVYRVRDLAWSTYGVYTNKVPTDVYRGAGRPEAAYMVERVMDLIARDLNMDPVEVRRKNFIPKDAFPYKTATDLEYDSGDYEGALKVVLEMADYPKLREEQKRLREQGVLMGIGLTTTTEMTGFGPSNREVGGTGGLSGFESATIRVDPSGRITVLTGSSPHGQGLQTTFAQIVADELGVPFDDIEILYGDTAIIPQGSGTYGSRSLVVGGSAIVKAGELVREKARRIAAGLLNIDPQYVVLERGAFFAEDIPDRYVTWADVGDAAYRARSLPEGMELGLEATTFWEPPELTYPFSAHVAVVHVDSDTGEVKLSRYIAVDDSGNIINPMVVEGQVHGGLAQGIGAALLEEATWDEGGQLVTGSFLDYAIPSAQELPTFELGRTVTPSPHNPLGAKGTGELGTIASAPAIVSAVVDALSHLGVTHIDMPIKSEKVWRILKEKGVAQ